MLYCRRSVATSTFDHVTFRYRIDGPEVLHDVSFSVPAGQVIGIVGQSGSGKSTLAKLIQRLYVPERGRVLVDGVDLTMVDTTWLRRQLGVVLQENILFNRTIRDNIALAEPGMSMDRVVAAATLAGAHEFILEMPRATIRSLGNGAAVCPEASASVLLLLGHSCASPAFLSLTKLPARSTMKASGSFSRTCR